MRGRSSCLAIITAILFLSWPLPIWSMAETSAGSSKDAEGPEPKKKADEKDAGKKAELKEEEEAISSEKCLMQRPVFGDLVSLGKSFQNWSAGVAVSTQAIKYTFGTEKASSNTSAGVGVAFRYYGHSPVGDEAEARRLGYDPKDLDVAKDNAYGSGNKDYYQLPIYRIKPECRATTSDFGKERKEKLASSIFSIIPTVYATKPDSVNDIVVQPALLIGFFDDIISVGPGFSLTGPEKGKVFLVFSLGYGFKF